MNKLITGAWQLSGLKEVVPNNLKVFSCFHCGGGSSMGYKLSGFEVLGGVEIDPEMMRIYKANHNPKHSYLMGVQDFNKIPNEELPKELFDLDVLDGSPPCSSFSVAGSRDKAWGEEKHFREGQAKQVLDDLFFDFIDIAKKLKPKVVVAENVKGLVIGKARGYVKEIYKAFNDAGYDVQLFLLNAAFMGVPQKRERTFFVARRKDLGLKTINLNFNEPTISCEKAFEGLPDKQVSKIATELATDLWNKTKNGDSFSKAHERGSWFNHYRLDPKYPSNTLTGHSASTLYHWKSPRSLSDDEILRLQTFPLDYKFLDTKVGYLCGMSVPPLMMQRVSNQIAHQWFGKPELVNG